MGEFDTSVVQPAPLRLDVQPQQDPLEAVMKYRQSQQQLAAGELQQQVVKQKLKSQQAIADALRNWDPATPATTIIKRAADNGAMGDDLATFQQHLADMRQKNAAADKEQLDLDLKRHDQARGIVESIAAAPAEQKQTLWQQYTPQIQHLLDPGEQLPEQYPGDDQARTFSKLHSLYSTQIEESLKQQQAATSQAQAAEAAAGTEQKKAGTMKERRSLGAQELQAAIDPQTGAADPAEYARIREAYPELNLSKTQDAVKNKTLIRSTVPVEKQPEFDLNAMKARMGVLGNSEYDQFLMQYARSLGKNPSEMTPAEGLASFQKYAEMKQDPVMRQNAIAMRQLQEANLRLQQGLLPTPEDIDVQAKALINHSMSPTQFNELKQRQGGSAKVFTRATQLDPTFSLAAAEAQFKSWEKAEQDFTSGHESGLVRSNNNALEHLALLDQARAALKNNDVPALNAIANWFGVQGGSDKATVFDHIAARVGDEVTKAFIPGGGGEGERQAAGKGSYNSKMGDQQLMSNIRADVRLMDSQQRNLADQYKRATYGQGAQQLFTPEAMTARDRLLGGAPAPATGKPTAVPHVTTKAQFDALPKGAVYTEADGKTYRKP